MKIIKIILFLVLFFVILIPSQKSLALTVDELRAQKDEINRKINELNTQVEEKKTQAVSLQNQIAIFDNRIQQIELQIQATQLKIDELQEQINEFTKEIGRQQRMLDYQKKVLDDSLQILYERREQSLLNILLSADDFSDFVEQVTYLDTIKEQIRLTIVEINKIKNDLEEKRIVLSEQKSQQEDLRIKKDQEQNALESQRRTKELLLEQTKGEEEEFQKQLEQANNEEKSVESEIDRLIEEARKKMEKQYPNLSNGDGFGYPLSGVNRISVVGGDFMDPYYGFGFPHTGVDLYAAQSTPIYSIGDGVVVVAHDSGGAGLSYIAISHPSGLLSKYLHMSEIFVSNGQFVSRGEAIGLSGGAPGTRGSGYFTTGPHLHFEIDDENGNAINPHDFLDITPAY